MQCCKLPIFFLIYPSTTSQSFSFLAVARKCRLLRSANEISFCYISLSTQFRKIVEVRQNSFDSNFFLVKVDEDYKWMLFLRFVDEILPNYRDCSFHRNFKFMIYKFNRRNSKKNQILIELIN